MKRKVDGRVMQKFAAAAGILMTRVFSTPLEPNQRRLMFAYGPAMPNAEIKTEPHLNFDVLGFGFVPGREWKGPTEIFVEELREGSLRTWKNCHLWADDEIGPLYVLTEDPDVCFSYDGWSLVPLSGQPENRKEGIIRGLERLRAGARHIPNDIEQHRMM